MAASAETLPPEVSRACASSSSSSTSPSSSSIIAASSSPPSSCPRLHLSVLPLPMPPTTRTTSSSADTGIEEKKVEAPPRTLPPVCGAGKEDGPLLDADEDAEEAPALVFSHKRPRPNSTTTTTLTHTHTRSSACSPVSSALLSSSPPPSSPSPQAHRTGLLYDVSHRLHHHPQRKHPERPERVDAVMTYLQTSPKALLDHVVLVSTQEEDDDVDNEAHQETTTHPPRHTHTHTKASYESLAQVHHPHYLQRLKRLENLPKGNPTSLLKLIEEAEQFDSVYMNEATVDCARRAAGGLMRLVEAVVGTPNKQDKEQEQEKNYPPSPTPLSSTHTHTHTHPSTQSLRNGLALIRPPGHHAEPHHPHGFCIINNVAIAAQHARTHLGLSRILICDWDVHHGQGTQKMFLSDPSVLYFSVHRYDYGRFFPGTGSPFETGTGPGKGYTVNVGWNEAGMGDREYVCVWQKILLPIARAFAPELILVSAGFDGALGDEMGGCRVTAERGFGWMTRMLMEEVPSCGGKVVLALEGGYKLGVLGGCVEACLEALMVGGREGGKEEEGEGGGEKEKEGVGEEEEEGGGKKVKMDVQEEEEEEEEEEEDLMASISPSAAESIRKTIGIQREFWPCLRDAGIS